MPRLAPWLLCWVLVTGLPAAAQQVGNGDHVQPVAGYRPGSVLKAVPIYLQHVHGRWSASLTGDLKDPATERVDISLPSSSTRVMTQPVPGVRRQCLTKMKDRGEFGYLECNSAFYSVNKGSAAAATLLRGVLTLGILAATLATREAVLGADHPDTARSLNNVALVLTWLNKPADARPLLERSLAITEPALCDHVDVATSLVNLANVHRQLGELDRALALVTRALAIWDRLPDRKHTNYAFALQSHAQLLADRGDHDAAIAAYARILALGEATLGPGHLDIAGVLRPLAMTLLAAGDPAAALTAIDRALAIEEMHHNTQGYILNVASPAAFQPGPTMATYFATKAFVLSWSQALQFERKEK